MLTFSEAARTIRSSVNNLVDFQRFCKELEYFGLIDKCHKPTKLGWQTAWFIEKSTTWFDPVAHKKITTHHYFISVDGMNWLFRFFDGNTDLAEKDWIIRMSAKGARVPTLKIDD